MSDLHVRPGHNDLPICSSRLQDKLSRLRLDTFHRVKSAYLQDDGGGSSLTLPTIGNSTPPRAARSMRAGSVFLVYHFGR